MMGKGLGVIWVVLLIGGVLGSGLFDSNRPRRSVAHCLFAFPYPFPGPAHGQMWLFFPV